MVKTTAPNRPGLSVAVLALAVALAACGRTDRPYVRLHASSGPVNVAVEIAATPEKRTRGLMWREKLGADEGMLFVFDDARPRSFWMKNTPLPLDIVFIGPDRRVVAIAEHTEPYSTRAIPSGAPARWVLETNAGFCRKHGVLVGTEVELPPAALR
ncbi:MAG: DUF192 domain-containing protein [Candidatus Dadabacteria bacterium]|nr:MAG: DUF192 domain-containing protein [Candidatus Dadabacteria bacterium]